MARPRKSGAGARETLAVRLDPELLATLNAYCFDGPEQRERTAVVEAALRAWLATPQDAQTAPAAPVPPVEQPAEHRHTPAQTQTQTQTQTQAQTPEEPMRATRPLWRPKRRS